MKILSPFALHVVPPTLHISVDRNVQHYSECHKVNEHRRASQAHERKRDSRDREKTYCHAHVLDEVKCEVSCKSRDGVRCGFRRDLGRNIKTSAQEEEREDYDGGSADESHVF